MKYAIVLAALNEILYLAVVPELFGGCEILVEIIFPVLASTLI